MLIILEGPDNSGKTSLANRIVHELGPKVNYFHPGGRPSDLDAEGLCIEQQLAALSCGHPVIMDRCTPISQQVYNPDPQLKGWREHMWQRYVALGVLVIYCRPSTDRLLRVQDLTWREDETEEHKQKIIRNQHVFVKRYDDLMPTIPNISYDFEDRAYSEIIYSQALKGLDGCKECIDWFNSLINYRS